MPVVARALDIDRLRADTPGCRTVAHLNNAGSSLPPATVVDTVVAHLRREAEIGGYEAHAEADERIAATYDAIGALLGAPASSIAVLESATAAWDRAFLALRHAGALPDGSRVLLAASEYASNVIPVLQLAARAEVEPVFVPEGADGTLDVDALAALLDDRVAMVAVTHAPSQNGLLNDVVAVGRVLHDAGHPAWYLVDACQSAGQVPLDVEVIGCDFLSATGRKWLRGPRGTGFVYAGPRALDLEPFPLDLHSAVWHGRGYDVEPGARRYEWWEKSYAGVLGLGEAVRYALSLGIPAVRDRVQALASRLRDGLEGLDGVVVHDRGRVRSGIVTFSCAGVASADVAAAARAAGVHVSVSSPEYAWHDFHGHGLGPVVRASPHVFNADDDLGRLIEVVSTVGPARSSSRAP